ncbi:MAG: cupin domain-containing protein [Sulfitobacter sp.]
MTIIKARTAKVDEAGADNPLGPYRAELISDTGNLSHFGAFIEELPPGSHSSYAHWHRSEDEMVLVLSGEVVAFEDGVATTLYPGDAACWKAGDPVAHTLHNQSNAPVRYVVIGTRSPQDVVTYPDRDRVLHLDRATQTRRYTTLSGDPSNGPETAP